MLLVICHHYKRITKPFRLGLFECTILALIIPAIEAIIPTNFFILFSILLISLFVRKFAQ